jgi:hypothetical protein
MSRFQIRLNQTLASQTVYNVTYWDLPGETELELEAFADALRASFASGGIAAPMSNLWSLNSIQARLMEGDGPFSQLVGFTSGAFAGVNAVAPLPLQSALLISLSALAPRPNRGRIYFAGLTEDANTTSAQVLSTTRDIFEALVTEWAAGLTTSEGDAFLRIVRPNFTTNVWTLFNPVDFVVSSQEWATQRRRRRGVGI